MQYMLLIYGSYDGWGSMTEESFGELLAAHGRLQTELRSTGELLATNELPLENAKIVRTKGGATAITDGPLNPTSDILAGYYLVECASVERAAEIASQLGEAEFGLVEVRQTTASPAH